MTFLRRAAIATGVAGIVLPVMLVAQAVPASASGYDLVNEQTDKCADAPNNLNYQRIEEWDCNYGSNQYFQLVDYSNGYYHIKNIPDNKCVQAPDTVWGEQLWIHDCNVGDNTVWWSEVWYNSPGAWAFVNKYNGLCMDLYQGNSTNGTKIIQWGCNGHWNQLWIQNYYLS